MRVAFVSRRYWPAVSGMSVYAENLLRELVAAGIEVVLFSQYYDGAHAGVYGGGPPPPVPGAQVIGLEALGEEDSGDFERDVATLRDAIVAEHARKPFDLLHAQYAYPTGWATLLASQVTGVPNLVSIQGGDGHWVGSCCETHRLAMLRVLEHAGALLIGGPSFAAEVIGRLGAPVPKRFTYVPGAVDVSRFHPAAERAPGPLRLLYHGRVDRRKGVLDMLEALARLDRPELAWSATVSGVGPDLAPARELAAARGLDARVRFTGYAGYEDAPAIYRDHDLFLSPTYSEGFSNTILEAMASGLPVLSCRAVGVVDCVRDGENGLLVEPGDLDDLTGALERLLRDADLRARLAADALAECGERYSWSAVAGRIREVYGRLVGTRPDTAFDPDLPLTPCQYREAPHLL